MPNLISTLSPHRERLSKPIADLFLANPQRAQELSFQVGGVFVDFSKQAIDKHLLGALRDFAQASQWRQAANAMAQGQPVNVTEGRSVEHMALRARPQKPAFAAEFAQMRKLVEQIHAGTHRSATEARFTDVLHIGIGGSHLGPQLVCEALRCDPQHVPRLRVHFLANIDGHALQATLANLDRDTTLVSIASKTMSTLETRLNAKAVRQWLAPANDRLADARLQRQVFAISAAPDKAREFGVLPEHVLPFSDSIGGRFSLWSTIGFPIALQSGWEAFEALHTGAREMDAHFLTAPELENLPFLSAAIGIWNRNGLGRPNLGISPYDERLRLLPAYLQQLEMESNGKSVDRQGNALRLSTVPALWGQTGTPGQHAYFQCLHQGTDVIPVDFFAVASPDHEHVTMHQTLLENCFAQSRALMCGRQHTDPHRQFAGNRPSTTLLLDRLTPQTLGTLLALYEHKVFVQGHLWNIFSFDQFGVELGKDMAQSLANNDTQGLDPSTSQLLARCVKPNNG